MKKHVLPVIALFLVVSSCFAQPIDIRKKYVKGEVTRADGTKFDGYIFFSFDNVDNFQNGVSAIAKPTYDNLQATGKIKNKEIERFSPKEVSYYTLESGMKFAPETYADLIGGVGMGSLPKKYLFEQLADGKIKLYKRYIGLDGVQEGADAELMMEGGQRLAMRNMNTYEFLLVKDGKNAKSVYLLKVEEYISDNPAVLAKFQAGEYGSMKGLDGKERPGFQADITRLITDYNK